MALPPLELFSLKKRLPLLPGGLFTFWSTLPKSTLRTLPMGELQS